jgi:hypothetical protein
LFYNKNIRICLFSLNNPPIIFPFDIKKIISNIRTDLINTLLENDIGTYLKNVYRFYKKLKDKFTDKSTPDLCKELKKDKVKMLSHVSKFFDETEFSGKDRKSKEKLARMIRTLQTEEEFISDIHSNYETNYERLREKSNPILPLELNSSRQYTAESATTNDTDLAKLLENARSAVGRTDKI